MKFAVSSSELLQGLLSVSRVITPKNTLPILDNFLFVLKDNQLEITASDLETTLRTVINIENVMEEGETAVPAKLLTDSLKEFPNQPLTFQTNDSESIIEMVWLTGSAQLPVFPADDFPALTSLSETAITVNINATDLLDGINSTSYATADEELRPVMNGIYFDITTEDITLVASDAHKLVSYTRDDVKSMDVTSFILPKKPAGILRNILAKSEEDVKISFDHKNAIFEFDRTMLICRLVEGRYPAYRSVIPKNNKNKLTISRLDFLNATKRVAVCSNQATSHVKVSLSHNTLEISAQDLSFSISAHESVACQYEGDNMEIGFKSPFLIEILSNLRTEEVLLELDDPAKAVLILPVDPEDEHSVIKALLMPILINS